MTQSEQQYFERFAAAVRATGFTFWDDLGANSKNFPGERFEGGAYDLVPRELPYKEGGHTADEIDAIVEGWRRADATVLGSATAGDGLFYARQLHETRGSRRPKEWVVCAGSTSVRGELLSLRWDPRECGPLIRHRHGKWGGGDNVLLRIARAA